MGQLHHEDDPSWIGSAPWQEEPGEITHSILLPFYLVVAVRGQVLEFGSLVPSRGSWVSEPWGSELSGLSSGCFCLLSHLSSLLAARDQQPGKGLSQYLRMLHSMFSMTETMVDISFADKSLKPMVLWCDSHNWWRQQYDNHCYHHHLHPVPSTQGFFKDLWVNESGKKHMENPHQHKHLWGSSMLVALC